MVHGGIAQPLRRSKLFNRSIRLTNGSLYVFAVHTQSLRECYDFQEPEVSDF